MSSFEIMVNPNKPQWAIRIAYDQVSKWAGPDHIFGPYATKEDAQMVADDREKWPYVKSVIVVEVEINIINGD